MIRGVRNLMAALGLVFIVLALVVSTQSCYSGRTEEVPDVEDSISKPEPTIQPAPGKAVEIEELYYIFIPTATPEPKSDSLDSEIYWLARGMQEEDGIEWSDEDILKIGTVIANRKEDPRFPDTYKAVLLQEGQYQPFFGYVEGESELTKPEDHYIYLAGLIMEGYRSWEDPSVIWQACFFQGTEIVDTVYDPYLGSTTYFCR